MTKKFWTYLETDRYNIGLTNKTTYIFDKNGNEKAKFSDLNFANKGCVSPDKNTLVVKSTDGRIAILKSCKKIPILESSGFSRRQFYFFFGREIPA